MEFLSIIKEFGFPVFCVIACGWFILRLWNDNKQDKERLYQEIAESRVINGEAIRTLALYAEKLDTIKDDVEAIKERVFSGVLSD